MKRKKTNRLSEIKCNNYKIFLYLMSFKCMFKTSKIRIACLILLLSIHTIGQCVSKVAGNYKLKTIVLDAGHGGHDSGCHGSAGSYEKDVTLEVILKLGKYIEEKYPDIKVLYSRKTDVFITLQDRALLANKNNADLFISVHCNANANKSAYGTETFLMGLHVSQANLEVAKRENEVIKLEKDYETTYGDFDPDSPESIIAITMQQSANIEQSSYIATKVQENLTTKLNRFNRGVKQAGFWVLYRTTCPSILIETGFLTNKTEEKFLTSEDGQTDLANAIFHAFEDYKNTVEKGNKLTPPVITNSEYIPNTEEDEPEVVITKPIVKPITNPVKEKDTNDETPSQKGIIYKVQIKSSAKLLAKTDKAYKLYSNLKYEKENGMFKYAYAPFSEYDLALKVLKKAKASGYKDAFIVVFKDGKKLSVSEAKKYLQ